MKQEYLELFDKINGVTFEATQMIVRLEHEVVAVANLKHLADMAYVVKESSDLAKGLRVELDKLGDHIAKIFFILYAADPDAAARVRTEWCSALPDPKTHSSIPKLDSDPVGYAACLRDFGVPEETIATGVMRISWDAYSDYCTKLVREGKPLPGNANPNKTYVEHRVSLRGRRKLGDPRRESGDGLVPLKADDNDAADDPTPF